MVKNRKPGIKRRAPVVNGIYYPERKEALIGMLNSWGLKENFPAMGGQAILAPHGAWDLTGNIAAKAFENVQRNRGERGINRVLVLGTHHQAYDEGIYLSESTYFETPLGSLAVDRGFNKKLASCSTLIRVNDIPHLSEHSLEVLLPLVKYCFPKARIIPILMIGSRPALVSSLAKALRITLETYMKECLIIISSSVSQNLEPALACSMADTFSLLLEKMDSAAFLSQLTKGRVSACGGALVGAFLESGLLDGKHFSALLPLAQGKGERGETVYYGAFGA